MLDFMFKAPVGDDVFGDDPTVIELEQFGAHLFGQDAGLFCPSGTMTNQIAINVHCKPGDELICHEEAHIYRYEGGGIAKNSGTSVRLLRGNFGRLIPSEITDCINPDDIHNPITRLISVEDTANRGGGLAYNTDDLKAISEIARASNLAFHLDGARVFNALHINKMPSQEYGRLFNSISVCLSKGLGAPVGSLLLGNRDFIKQARRVRKVMGGGMRQAGIIAAGGLYALRNNIDRLVEDHARAKELEKLLQNLPWIDHVIPVETNILVAVLAEGLSEKKVVEELKKNGILAVGFGKGRIRMVTHLNFLDDELRYVAKNLPYSV